MIRHAAPIAVLLIATTLGVDAPATTNPKANTPPVATSPQHVIQAGDQLNVQVFGQSTLSQTVTVLPDGSISYPLVGRIPVAGQTVDAAQNTITSKLGQYVRHPNVTIAITQLGQPSVLVLGDVKTPGKYQLRSGARITDAIAAAGGIADVNGDLPQARVSDAQGQVSTVSLQSLLHDGQVNLDKSVGEGDVVYVPGPVAMNVTVTGAVDHPGEITVAEGDHLSMAIAKAGNSANSNADLNNIRVMRATDGHAQQFTVNLYQALEKGDTSADVALQKGDTIYVPQARQHTNILTASGGLLAIFARLLIP